MARPTVLLADDHRLVAVGIKSILEKAGFEVLGLVETGEALAQAILAQQPDLVVAELNLGGSSMLSVLRQLLAAGHPVRLVFLTMHRQIAYARRALGAGAAGYVLKHAAPDELVQALNSAMQNKFFSSPALGAVHLNSGANSGGSLGGNLERNLGRRLEAAPDVNHGGLAREPTALTPRQEEIGRLLIAGKSAKEIGGILGISSRTAEFHKYRMMDALGVTTTGELIHRAVKLGLGQT